MDEGESTWEHLGDQSGDGPMDPNVEVGRGRIFSVFSE